MSEQILETKYQRLMLRTPTQQSIFEKSVEGNTTKTLCVLELRTVVHTLLVLVPFRVP